MSPVIKTVTDQNFQTEVLHASQPVLVDYWAEWCSPCRMIAPILEESAIEHAGRLTVAKLNVDENPGTATRYHVRSIPTLMLFRDGQPIAQHVGSLSRAQLQAFIETHAFNHVSNLTEEHLHLREASGAGAVNPPNRHPPFAGS